MDLFRKIDLFILLYHFNQCTPLPSTIQFVKHVHTFTSCSTKLIQLLNSRKYTRNNQSDCVFHFFFFFNKVQRIGTLEMIKPDMHYKTIRTSDQQKPNNQYRTSMCFSAKTQSISSKNSHKSKLNNRKLSI